MLYLTVGTRNMNKNNWPDCWGHITAAYGGSKIEPGRYWAVDNGAFVGRFNPNEFTNYLEQNEADEYCLFVVAPDVIFNAPATMDSFRYWAWRIKEAGWPVAFVAQDGQESFDLPPEYDCLFIGGSTEWKMSKHVRKLIRDAKKKISGFTLEELIPGRESDISNCLA